LTERIRSKGANEWLFKKNLARIYLAYRASRTLGESETSGFGLVTGSVIELDRLRPGSHRFLITLCNCHFLQT
jgi:hypothetical protein